MVSTSWALPSSTIWWIFIKNLVWPLKGQRPRDKKSHNNALYLLSKPILTLSLVNWWIFVKNGCGLYKGQKGRWPKNKFDNFVCTQIWLLYISTNSQLFTMWKNKKFNLTENITWHQLLHNFAFTKFLSEIVNDCR